MAKITHIFKTFYPDEPDGGIQEVIHQLGLISIKNGYEVEVISLSKKPGVCNLDGIKCISYKTNIQVSTMPISFDLVRDFSQIIENTDILHLHYPFPFAELLALFYKINKPIVITFHAPIEGRTFLMKCYAPFAKRLFKKADIIIPTSQNLASTEGILRNFKNKIHPIGLWIADNRFSEESVKQEFIHQVNEYGQFALFVGAFRKYKGLHYLLDAAKKVNKNILLAGRGPLFDEISKRVDNEQLQNVHLLGYQPNENIAYLFKKCQFVVLPSITRGECFGVVLLEACHYKKAMISTELGTGTSWVNANGKTGFVIKPCDSNILAEKMNYLFDNPVQCREFGIYAQKRSKELFSEDACGDEYLKLYKQLLYPYDFQNKEHVIHNSKSNNDK